jgi:hypothetical protein
MRYIVLVLMALVFCVGEAASAAAPKNRNPLTEQQAYKEGVRDYYSGLCFRARPYLDGPEDKERLWVKGFRDAEQRDHDSVDRSYCNGTRG